MTRLYDLMLLIDSSAPEDRQKAIVGEVETLLGDGTIAGSYDWGSRRIAFEIDHRPEASYQLFQFEGDNALLDRLNHNLKIMDGVLRFRIIRQGPGAPPVPPSPEPIRAQRAEEPDGRVAARAAADAVPEQEAAADPEPADAEPAVAEPAVGVAEPEAAEPAPEPEPPAE